MKKYSISEAARQLGVHRTTLHRWIEQGVIPEPITKDIAGARIRYWTKDAFAKIEEYKRANYWGRGRKRNRRKTTKELN